MAPKYPLLCLLLSLFLFDLVHTLWWSLGSRAIMDHSRICRKRGRRLAKDPQSVICRRQPVMFQLILEGAQMAMKECQFQFRNHRWNCSDSRRSLKKILSRDAPETAFLNAVVSAGVTHELTAACSRGDLLQCSCSPDSLGALSDEERRKTPGTRRKNKENSSRRKQRRQGAKTKRRKGKGGTKMTGPARRDKRRRTQTRGDRRWPPSPQDIPTKAQEEGEEEEEEGEKTASPPPPGSQTGEGEVPREWHWTGCDDNVGFGARTARDFMDWRYLRGHESRDIRSIVMLWNNEAGRRAVKNHLVPHCKCHGLSGSCTHQTCWRRMPSFRNVGRHLMEKFTYAIKVLPGNDGETVMPATDSIRTPRKQDLVYLEDSPNFCSTNKRTGSLGTEGRTCNASSSDLASCEILCCGRGYTQQEHWVEENCRCRFRYCCEVTCQKCSSRRVISHCR